MVKRYTLPAVTIDGQDTSIEIAVDDVEKLRTWLHNVRILEETSPFRFHWSRNPYATAPHFLGVFCVLWYQDGIYIKLKLCYEDYQNVEYPLDCFCGMLFKSKRPSLGWCIAVTVQ